MWTQENLDYEILRFVLIHHTLREVNVTADLAANLVESTKRNSFFNKAINMPTQIISTLIWKITLKALRNLKSESRKTLSFEYLVNY